MQAPSYREIAIKAEKAVGASTLCEALDSNKQPRLPTLKLVQAFIHGCGGTEDDLTSWTTAWRCIRMSRTASSARQLPTGATPQERPAWSSATDQAVAELRDVAT
ncbi:hypothetical protein ACFWY5_56175 [Nonomuraea sp. NPDC059007]|uniref:hypothetical protein n=1 Tax=Nonomuraea sp. NPDC059007 TaxID=3346692 RepID=UPI0036A375A5